MFSILNTVYENIMRSSEVDCVLPMINELLDNTRQHFAAEEQFMRDRSFRELNAHIAKHAEFTCKIETLKAQYHGNDLEVTRELIIVLGEWLLNHVLKEDRKYADILPRRG